MKTGLYKLLSIKKRFHIFSLEHQRVDEETIKMVINGIVIQTKNPNAVAYLKYWKDSPSAFADLMEDVSGIVKCSV